MPRPTRRQPDRGEARRRLLDAARDLIRTRGFTATSIDDLCRTAEVSKGAFFHHFENKEALGVAAAEHWSETTSTLFREASYHEAPDPLCRVLAYLRFRRSIIQGEIPNFTCLAGTMAQEVHATHPGVRDACAASIFGHAETLVADIRDARISRGIDATDTGSDWTAESLARHMQAVLQGAFVLAKAGNESGFAIESVDHLTRYVRLLFRVLPSEEPDR